MRGWKRCGSLLLLLNTAALAQTPCPAERATSMRVGGQSFMVETAATPAARERGASGRPRLEPNTGMWFVLPTADRHGFWMRGMRFPIDLIWVSPELKVLERATLPLCRGTYCPITYPPAAVAYVLEVEAGRFRGRLGDTVRWSCEPGEPPPDSVAPASSPPP